MLGAPAAPANGTSIILPLCSQCGRSFASDDLVALAGLLVCAECKPVVAQKLREGILPLGSLHYAGFWIRAGAVIIDAILLYIAGMILTGLWLGYQGIGVLTSDPLGLLRSEGILVAVQLLMGVAYETWFIGKFGATPGKISCNLKVVRADGSRLSYSRAFARYNAKMVSSCTLCIGYLVAAFDEQKRALHDYVVDTRVVRK